MSQIMQPLDLNLGWGFAGPITANEMPRERPLFRRLLPSRSCPLFWQALSVPTLYLHDADSVAVRSLAIRLLPVSMGRQLPFFHRLGNSRSHLNGMALRPPVGPARVLAAFSPIIRQSACCRIWIRMQTLH